MARHDISSILGITFDVAVIGGGVMGTAVARDAALRGLHVLLVEKDDLGSGTSSRSSRLIHGGLRYLAHLDFRLVREDLGERELLLRNAPHLVKPLPFLIPIYGRGIWGRLQLGAGLTLYDLMARGSRLPKHRWLSRKQVVEAEPALDTRGLQGAFLYYDAQVPLAERLCIENALDAEQHGATVLNHGRVVEITRHGAAYRACMWRTALPMGDII
jgi:glycerol-3-phosphate dehydrogenase